jgi:predicted lactoylglutathione lyase
MANNMIFVNLPAKDLPKTKEFWQKLGYSFNPQFTDDNAGCLVISDNIFAMLLTEPYYKTFTDKQIADTSRTQETQLALSADSREEVDEMLRKALAAGAKEPKPAQDMEGFMYSRGFDDLDGHHWDYVWMNPSAVQG